jgi:transposase
MQDEAMLAMNLGKHSFHLHAQDDRGHEVYRKKFTRAALTQYLAKLEPCTVVMEACGGAHYWARKLVKLGHEVKLMAPQFVKPYVKTNKNDVADAEAISEAVSRPNMRFVPIKTAEQQSVLCCA